MWYLVESSEPIRIWKVVDFQKHKFNMAVIWKSLRSGAPRNMLRKIMIHYLTYTCRFIPYFRSLPKTATAIPVNVFSAHGRLNFEFLSLHPVMAAYVVPPSSYACVPPTTTDGEWYRIKCVSIQRLFSCCLPRLCEPFTQLTITSRIY